jgi:SAM-dependent methyltransferase
LPPGSAAALVARIQPAGKRVLVVGCRDGELGAELRAAGAAEVVGLDPLAGRSARERLTAVFRVSADATPPLPYPDGYFDALVVDVLGRLEAPLAALAHLRRWLADEGLLVVRPASEAERELVARVGFAELDGPPGEGPGAAAEVLAARPAVRLGAAAAPIPDPWVGSRPTRLLITPDPASPFWEALVAGAAFSFAGNRQVTIGVALPQELVEAPPPGLRQGLAGLDVDVLLLLAPAEYEAWERLVAGATLWIGEPSRPDLRAMAVRAGVDVDGGP